MWEVGRTEGEARALILSIASLPSHPPPIFTSPDLSKSYIEGEG